MRYFLILAMFFALAQAKQARVDISISTPNVFIDIGGGGHYYKRGYKNHHKDYYRGYYKRGYIPRHHYRPQHYRPYSRW